MYCPPVAQALFVEWCRNNCNNCKHVCNICTNPVSNNHFTFCFAMGLMMCLILIVCSPVWINVLLWRMLFSVRLWCSHSCFTCSIWMALRSVVGIYLNCLLFISLHFRFLFSHPPCHLISCFYDSSSPPLISDFGDCFVVLSSQLMLSLSIYFPSPFCHCTPKLIFSRKSSFSENSH